MKNNNKIFALLFVFSICFACSDKKDATEKTQEKSQNQEQKQEQEQEQNKNPTDARVPTPKPENTLNVTGKECNLYFAKDAVEQAQAKGTYLNLRRSVFVGDEGILLTSLIYKEKKLQIAVNFFHVGKEVCITDFSPIFVGFPDNEIHSLSGLQKGNCALVHEPTEVGAIGMYHLPVNSKLFKRFLFAKVTTISVQMKNDVGVFKAYDEKNAKDFRNAIRCAYETLGPGIDLNNESILVDTIIHQGNK